MTSPLRDKNVWLFNSAQFSGNPKWLMIYIARRHPEIEVHWLADSRAIQRQVEALGFSAILKGGAGSAEILRRTGVWVVNQVKEVIPDELHGAVLLNLWHGVGVKGIERGMNEGYLRERIAKKYIVNNQYYRDHQLFLVTSPLMENHFAANIGLDDETTIRGGYPQNIVPLHEQFRSFDHDVRARKGLPASTRIAVYAPTPRREQSTVFLDRALPDLPRLNSALQAAGILLIIKMHPHMTADPSFVRMRGAHGGLSNILFWDNTEDIYEIAKDIDLGIVDYSSILYDLVALGVRSHIRYAFDLEDSGNDVLEGDLDYLSLSVGTLATSFDELVTAVGGDNRVAESDLQRISQTFWEYSSAESIEGTIDRALAFSPRSVALPTLYTYDVFDTIFHRRGVEPFSVFAYVKQNLERTGAEFPPHLVAGFVAIRRQAEQTARQNRRARRDLQQSGRLEITLADIYARIQAVYELTDDQIERLMAWEIEAELHSVTPDRRVIDELFRRRADGGTIALLSDQYLPEATVRQMLSIADPRLDEIPLFLSNTWQAQKTTGRLFLTAYDDLDYDFAKWVHTGDNERADVTRPSQLGIATRKLETPQLGKQEQRIVERLGTYDAYLVAGLLHEMRKAESHTDVELFALRHVAFYLVPYVNWVVRDALERGYERLWFVSRDGYHMQRIADAIIAERGLSLETGYIYGSRRAWRLASMIDDIDDDHFFGHGSLAGVSTPHRLLESAELTADEFRALFPQYAALLGVEEISRAQLADLQEAMHASPAYREHLLEVAARQRDVLVRYLEQEMDLTERFAFVEYWGRGYTQDCLTRVIDWALDSPVDVPFYYARSIYPTDPPSVRHNFTLADHSLLFIEALFANLPYGSVTGYAVDGDTVRPVYATRPHDVDLHDALERMLPEFARRYAGLPVLDGDRLDREVFEFGFEHYRDRPDAKVYVKYLAPLKDSVSMGAAEREFAPAITLRDLVMRLRGESLRARTTSLPLSLARSGLAVRAISRAQRRLRITAFLRSVRDRLK